ncbi:MAG TPA: zf-HC2 domain-containing protein [Acidimicrobiales bacterium]|nr:zf-HC2 domain-containing protein [Acidimicrobiales bacterium]
MSLDCALARNLLPEYAAGALDGRDRSAVEAHLQACAECRTEADAFVEVADAVLGLAPLAEPPVGFEAKVLSRVQGASAPRRGRRVALRLLAAAAALLVVGLGLGRLSAPSTSRDLHTVALRAKGTYVGKAWVHAGTPGWIYVDMRSDESYPSLTLQVVDQSGHVTPVGDLALRAGHGTLGARSPVPVATIRTIRMIEPDGSIVCRGTLS